MLLIQVLKYSIRNFKLLKDLVTIYDFYASAKPLSWTRSRDRMYDD